MTSRKRLGLAATLLVLMLAVSGLPGCDKTEEEEAACDWGGEGPQIPRTPVSLSTTPKFLDAIGKESHAAADAPAVAPALRWDFSGSTVYAYDYRQEMVQASSLGGTSIEGDGTLLLKSKGDKTATLVLTVTKMTMGLPDGERKTPPMNSPAMVVPGVKEDGTMEIAANPANSLLRMLFPLPPRPLKVGESARVPNSMPFNAMGSALTVEGGNTITLTGYVTIDGRTCARLETDIDISKLEVPEELEGTYKCFLKGKSISYFDIQTRGFVSVEAALAMGMAIEPPKDDEGGADGPAVFPIAMQMDTVIRLRRNPEKAKPASIEKD